MSRKTSKYYRELAYECLNLRNNSTSLKSYKYYYKKALKYYEKAERRRKHEN